MASVLVTGTSTGIGQACALRLDRRGHQVFAGVRRDADGERLRDRASGRLTPVLLDVTDPSAIETAIKTIDAEVGSEGLTGLVNNAGIARGGPLEHLPLEEWRTQLEVNVIGQVAVTKSVIPMLRRAGGRLVFIGSIGGRFSSPLMAPYGASKFALEGICESLRHELRPSGIQVVLIEPGAVKTPIWEKGQAYADELEGSLPGEARERYAPFVDGIRKAMASSERRGVSPEHVAKVVEAALCSPHPRARYLVGMDAKAVGLLSRVLPDSLKDPVMRRLASL